MMKKEIEDNIFGFREHEVAEEKKTGFSGKQSGSPVNKYDFIKEEQNSNISALSTVRKKLCK
jgi:hypothetical protein